jgi:hypothetical protein
MDEVAIACGQCSYVRRRRFLRIERGEVGREREPARLAVGVEKFLPADRDQVSRGAPDIDRFAASVCSWLARREHLASKDDHAQGEPSSCGLRD